MMQAFEYFQNFEINGLFTGGHSRLCLPPKATPTSCSNVGLRLPRVRGLSASMVDKANFLMKEQSYV